MNKRFQIVIKEQSIEERPAGVDWERGAGDKPEDKDNWGYTPEITKKKEIERTVFTQDVEELDLKSVIKAVNGI